jgi:flavin reductase (DIM6/NTAB) family NADH-FMN oxidoreductase RutF
MKSFNPYDIHIRERHQYITGAVGPRPICWASTVNEKGESNLAPYSFFNAFGSNPPILVFSSNRRGRDNSTKDTLHNIKETMEVVINVVPHRLVNQMNISSTDYPSTTNEFEKAGVTGIDSITVKPKRVKESPVQFECKVKEIISLGDVGGAGNLFICEVSHMHIDEAILDAEGMIDPQKIDLVGRMGKEFYVRASGDAVFEINNPFEKMNIGFDGLPKRITQSKVLTGNQIAQLAMEISLPDPEECKSCKSSLDIKSGNIERHAQLLISKGKVREALCLLLA